MPLCNKCSLAMLGVGKPCGLCLYLNAVGLIGGPLIALVLLFVLPLVLG